MSDQPELFGDDELGTPVPAGAPGESKGRIVIRDIAAVDDGPLKRLVNENFLN